MKRENLALSSNIEIFRRSEEQLRQENSSLKELVNNIELERIHFRATSELLQRELAYTKKENASFLSNEQRIPSLGALPNEAPSFPPPMNDLQRPPQQNPMENYQYLLPKNEFGEMPSQPTHSSRASMEDLYKPPQPNSSLATSQQPSTSSLHENVNVEDLRASSSPSSNIAVPDNQQNDVSIWFRNFKNYILIFLFYVSFEPEYF